MIARPHQLCIVEDDSTSAQKPFLEHPSSLEQLPGGQQRAARPRCTQFSDEIERGAIYVQGICEGWILFTTASVPWGEKHVWACHEKGERCISVHFVNSRRFASPVLQVVLDDAQRVDPEISYAELGGQFQCFSEGSIQCVSRDRLDVDITRLLSECVDF